MGAVEFDASKATWRKSSYSDATGQCVEVADDLPGALPIRDSKHPDGPHLVFAGAAWTAFVAALHAGGFSASA
ncbi:DUF397 domain-containing protein [Streptomyces ipomoeae]|uniref:DUF397 domain-containing protein n=1 Tax=Streptomyces ipomoeae TaxID=103232 RepID=UPI0006620579|nr:DUF397 domain-containing protein [Streptomyces ipomoeae]